MTDPRDKQQQRDRYRRGARHQRSREEELQLKQARGRRGDADRGDCREDDDESFAPMRRRERVLGRVPPVGAVVPNAAQLQGVVVAVQRGRARVRFEIGGEGHERDAVLAPELARTQQQSVAVGDDVTLHARDDGAVVLAAVGARRSELVRSDPGNEHLRRVVAANVDVVVLVLAADRARLGLVDRLRAALAASGASLLVCVNKCDLPHDRPELAAGLRPHLQAGVPVVFVSATEGEGLPDLEALVRGRTVALVGHSGVGKSTLLNRIDPAGARATGAVRERDGKGRHTTTSSRLTVLADGTRLIDTPGVRAFGLPEGDSDALAAFDDIAALGAHCRFRDCVHDREPGCAVRAAVEEGALPAARLAAFHRLRPS